MRKKSMRFISAALAACMMASTLPVGAFALEGDTAPESGVSTQAEETVAETVTTIPTETKVYTIAEGGNYELLGGNYGRIEINMTDTTKPVNITIKGNVAETLDDPLFNVTKAGVVNINNEGNYEVDCATVARHFMYMHDAASQVTITKGRYKSVTFNTIMVWAGTLIVNDAEMESNCYCIYAGGSSSSVTVNGGKYTHTNLQDRSAFFCESGSNMTLNDVTATSVKTVVINNASTVTVNGGDFKTTGSNSCFVNNSSANLTINKGFVTDGTFESDGASCIKNNWGRVEINGGTIASNADSTINNRGTLRMNGGTVTTTNADATVIDCPGDYGDVKFNGGTISGGKDGIYLKNLGGSEATLQNVTFENNTNSNIHLGRGQQINIKKTFTGKAKILVDDAKAGRRITQENDDARYQKDLNLVSNNEGYIVGYKREDGVEYRYLADANGNAVSTQDAKATADLGAGAQQLDTTDVVPENTTVTVTADLPAGAEFLDWSVMADGQPLAYTQAEDDPQTITFTMPGCNVTVAALYQNNTPDPVTPGGGDDPVTEFFEAAAVTGVAAWGLYETATGIYRVLNMRGIPMPSNRAGLATLIWEKAGQPEPQTLKTYSDVDESDIYLRKAASWMEEQGLMEARDDGSFKPYGYVTKLRTCFVWDMARDRGLVG